MSVGVGAVQEPERDLAAPERDRHARLRLHSRGVGVTGETPNPLDVLREARMFCWSRPSAYDDEKVAALDVALAQMQALAEAAHRLFDTLADVGNLAWISGSPEPVDAVLQAIDLALGETRPALVPFATHNNTND